MHMPTQGRALSVRFHTHDYDSEWWLLKDRVEDLLPASLKNAYMNRSVTGESIPIYPWSISDIQSLILAFGESVICRVRARLINIKGKNYTRKYEENRACQTNIRRWSFKADSPLSLIAFHPARQVQHMNHNVAILWWTVDG